MKIFHEILRQVGINFQVFNVSPATGGEILFKLTGDVHTPNKRISKQTNDFN
jgi:hypothetical protein